MTSRTRLGRRKAHRRGQVHGDAGGRGRGVPGRQISALHGAFLPQCFLCCAQIQGQNCSENAQGDCEFLLYILVTLHTPGVVVFPAQQHLPHCLPITPERAGVQSLIRRVIVWVVQSVAPIVLDGVVKHLEAAVRYKHRRRHARQTRQTPQMVILRIKPNRRREVLHRRVGNKTAAVAGG